MHWIMQILCISSTGGACLSANVRVGRSTVSTDFIYQASSYNVRRKFSKLQVDLLANSLLPAGHVWNSSRYEPAMNNKAETPNKAQS